MSKEGNSPAQVNQLPPTKHTTPLSIESIDGIRGDPHDDTSTLEENKTGTWHPTSSSGDNTNQRGNYNSGI